MLSCDKISLPHNIDDAAMPAAANHKYFSIFLNNQALFMLKIIRHTLLSSLLQQRAVAGGHTFAVLYIREQNQIFINNIAFPCPHNPFVFRYFGSSPQKTGIFNTLL